MIMVLHIGWWAGPAIITIGVWAAVFLKPMAPHYGDYNFGDAVDRLVRLVVGVVVTLVVWLIYFMLAAFGWI